MATLGLTTALGEMGDERAIRLIRPRLDDIRVDIRLKAAISLARLGGEQLLDHADVLFEPNDKFGRRVLFQELNRFSAPETWRRLRDFELSNPSYTGTPKEILDSLSRESGVSIDVSLPNPLPMAA